MIRDEQTHALPEDPADRARLCLNMGSEDWPTALARIDAARREVAQQFEALLSGGPDPQRRNGEGTLGWLEAEGVDIGEELAKRGFPTLAISAVAKELETYRHAAPYRRLDEAGRRRVHVILDGLLEAAARQPAPAVVVQRVLRVLDAIGARSSYLALLKEQPPALGSPDRRVRDQRLSRRARSLISRCSSTSSSTRRRSMSCPRARASRASSRRAPNGSRPTIRSGRSRRCAYFRRSPCSRWRSPTSPDGCRSCGSATG